MIRANRSLTSIANSASTSVYSRQRVQELFGIQKGVGLIEVLVALVILSIGFLVAANMQIRGMRSNQHAYHQSQAMLLVGEMMDRMRNNREGVAAGTYDDRTTDTSTKPTCFSSGCNVAGVADLDIFEWSANLESLRGESEFVPMLPFAPDGSPAVGSISDPDANGVYTVSLSWQQVEGGDTTTESVQLNFKP